MEHYVPTLSQPTARWLRFLGLLAVLVAAGWLVHRLSNVLTPIAIALALAYIVNPLIHWLERRGAQRLLSVTVIFVLVIGGLLAVLTVLTYMAAVQLLALARNMPAYFTQAHEWLSTNQPDLMRQLGDREQLAALAGKYGQDFAAHLSSVAAWIFGGAASWIVLIVLVPTYTFFFLWKFDRIVQVCRDLLPGAYRPTVVRVVGMIDKSMSEFFRGRLIVCAIYGLLIGLGWMIVGTPYSLPLGVLAGALNLVPALSILVLPPALICSFVEAVGQHGGWVWPVTYTAAVYVAAQAVESFILAPYVIGQTSGLHPITTVVVLFIGGELGGVLGLLLSIPIASTLKSLTIEFVMPELRRLATEPPRERPASPPPPS